MRTSLPLLAFTALLAGLAAGCGAGANPRLSQKSGTLDLLMGADTLVVGGTMGMGVSGGVAPFVFSVASGSGSVNASTGVFTAAATPGYVTLRVRDARGEIDFGYLVVTATTVGTTVITLPPATVGARQTHQLVASGGTAPYAYGVLSANGGTISGDVYTAPGTAGSYTVQATDATGLVGTATITVTASTLALTPAAATVATGQTQDFTVAGGTGPYTFAVTAGGGTVTPTGTYTAPALPASAVLTVTDSIGNTKTAQITSPANYSLTPMSGGGSLIVDAYAAITFSNHSPTTQDQPTLGLFGLGPSASAASVGANGSTASMVALNNFSNTLNAPVSYRGFIEIRGRSATARVSFCVAPTARGIAYLRQESGPTDSGFISRSFNASNNALFNGRPTRTFIANVDTPSNAGAATVAFQAGYTTQLDCSDYDVANFVTVY